MERISSKTRLKLNSYHQNLILRLKKKIFSVAILQSYFNFSVTIIFYNTILTRAEDFDFEHGFCNIYVIGNLSLVWPFPYLFR